MKASRPRRRYPLLSTPSKLPLERAPGDFPGADRARQRAELSRGPYHPAPRVGNGDDREEPLPSPAGPQEGAPSLRGNDGHGGGGSIDRPLLAPPAASLRVLPAADQQGGS